MSGFQDVIAADNAKVFLNLGEFAERRTIRYDGDVFEDIPVVLTGLKEKDRRQLTDDHAQGLHLVTSVLHCRIDDMGGKQPEKGQILKINGEPGDIWFFHDFYVVKSDCELGMLRVELEKIDE